MYNVFIIYREAYEYEAQKNLGLHYSKHFASKYM